MAYIIDKAPTPAQQARLLRMAKNIQEMYTLAEVLRVMLQMDVTDVKFKGNIPLNNEVRNLKQAINGIQLHLAQYGQVRDREDFSNDFSIAMYRVLQFFAYMPTDAINSFMDKCDTIKEGEKNER